MNNASAEVTSPGRIRKGKKKASAIEEKPLTFDVGDVVNHVADVEMGDATVPRKTRVNMTRDLLRPDFEDIDLKRIAEIDEQLMDVPLDVLRMNLDLFAPE